LQLGADLGIVGMSLLLLYYTCCAGRLWPLARAPAHDIDPWMSNAARMVITALVGFMISAQFVSINFLELPYYINLFGAGVLKLSSVTEWSASWQSDR
jgi:hypothetical protein